MSVPDFFDDNAYAHESRTDFMNYAIIDSGAFDYAADQFDYTWGIAGELNQKTWAVRGGYFLVPTVQEVKRLRHEFLSPRAIHHRGRGIIIPCSRSPVRFGLAHG
jgi:hypothetical protein